MGISLSYIAIAFLSVFSIPEPGILLHGYIRDDSCLFQKETTLSWSLTPEVGGATHTFNATFKPTTTQEGLVFYKVHIPLATYIVGCPPPAGAIVVTDVPKKYICQLQIEGTDLVRTDTMLLSAADRGTFRRRSFVW